jgi:radical SAM protein with 4Fe4S-binding SPASM domain
LSRFLNRFLPAQPLLYPYFMQIEPTTHCDLACRFCPRESLPIGAGTMTLDSFRRVIDRNPLAVAILLQGLGEPLLNPEIDGMIRHGRSKGIYMGICTNGMGLTGDRFDRLMRSGLNYLAISVDGIGESFETMRGGARFDVLEKHLHRIRSMGTRGCLLAFWTRLSPQNLDQVLPVLDLAGAFGVDHVHFQDLQYKQDPLALSRLSLSTSLDRDGRSALLASARDRAAQEGIVCTFDPLDRHQRRTHCRWPWEGIYVDCSGDVWPCCVAWEEGSMMGNLLDSSLPQIWKGEKYRRFRLALRDCPLPRICEGCRFL